MKALVTIICILFLTGACQAQLCSGSLGDPIVHIKFGQGPNPGAPIAAAATGYTYTPNDCPPDGSYTIRSNTTQCFDATWHSVQSDHTGGNGHFMLVNASYQPSDFYLDTVRGLCPSSTYEFAAWIMNVVNGTGCSGNSIQPNLTFRIESLTGTVIQTYNTGNIPHPQTPTWNQYGSFFTTPAGISDVVLRITNNAPGGCGNDLALDDITFRPCGPMLTPTISGQSGTSAILCQGITKDYTFSVVVSAGMNNPAFQWQEWVNGQWADIPGENNSNYTRFFPGNTVPGTYTYRLAVAETGNLPILKCRIVSNPLTITVEASPIVTVSNTGPACEQAAVTLTATGGGSYTWTGPSGFTGAGPSIQLSSINMSQAGKYYATVTNAAGCSKRDSTLVTVLSSPVAIPAFTDSSTCKGNSIRLFVQDNPSYTYQWFPVTGLSDATIHNPVASPIADTRYGVAVKSQAGCSDTAYIMVRVKDRPVADAGPVKYLFPGQHVQLSGSIQGTYDQFYWSPMQYIGNAQTLSPAVNPPTDFTYYLTAVSSCGLSTDSVQVKHLNGLYIPNAFTPNNDGINDVWNIGLLHAFPGFQLYVYNRYGQLVYFNEGSPKPWDGKFKGIMQPMGTYSYLLKLPQAPNLLKGTVMIIH